jgi:deoxyribonuclease IV
MSRLGAHVSTAGGLSTCMPRAQAMGCECMQIFLSPPQRWQAPKHSDEQVDEFKRLIGEAEITPTFAHTAYLVNLAAPDPGIRERTIENLRSTAAWADRIGLAGIVVHIGSARGQSVEDAEAQIASALEDVLKQGSQSLILLENSAGSGEYLGSRFEQIGQLIDRLDGDERIGLCLDTAHTFASGYDLRVDEGIRRTVDEIAQFIGIERLKLIHANDSKVGLNTFVDRHENIGKGQLGEDAFVRMLSEPALRKVAWVLEVPGYDDKGPDKPNLDELKRLALVADQR